MASEVISAIVCGIAGVWKQRPPARNGRFTEVKTINPFAKRDWEGTGVEPDVKVKSADALQTAEKLAEDKLLQKK